MKTSHRSAVAPREVSGGGVCVVGPELMSAVCCSEPVKGATCVLSRTGTRRNIEAWAQREGPEMEQPPRVSRSQVVDDAHAQQF
jgi:hypothetical protein